jgi:CRISPR system Cascade subunit CasE
MYLAEAIIPYETAAKMGFHTPWDWHRALWNCFPDTDDPAHIRSVQHFLSRMDQLETGQRAILLSREVPAKPPWCPSSAWRVRQIDRSFYNHASYDFSLIANPTVTRFDPDREARRRSDGLPIKNSNSRRVPIRDERELREWLVTQAARRGFQVEMPDQVRIKTLPRQMFAKESIRDSAPNSITLHRVRFDGVLSITDSEQFRQEWPKGIGRGRAFGNGFLVIIPRKNHTND